MTKPEKSIGNQDPTEKIKKKQKVSVSYTLKSFKGNNKKLLDGKVITEEEYNKLELIRGNAIKKYIKQEYGL